MNLDIQYRLKNNYLLQKYIREHSFYYKLLNRNPELIKNMENEMKKEYKLTIEDKINNFSEKLDLVSTFFNMMK